MNIIDRRLPLLILVCSLLWLSPRWPVTGGVITRVMGESHDHTFSLDTVLQGKGDVYPIMPGTIIYQHQETMFPQAPLWPTGNTVFVRHDGFLASGYFHLGPESALLRKRTVRTTDAIGRCGHSGAADTTGAAFRLVDLSTAQVLSPLTKLSPPEDRTPPKLYHDKKRTGVYVIGDTRLYPLLRHHPALRKSLHLAADVYDPVGQRRRRGLREVKVTWNGSVTRHIHFRVLARGRNRRRFGPFSYADIYYRGYYYDLGTVTVKPGKNELRLTFIDIAGLKTARVFNVYGRPQ